MEASGIGIQHKQRAAQLQPAHFLGRIQPVLLPAHFARPEAPAEAVIHAVIHVLGQPQAQVEDVILPWYRGNTRNLRGIHVAPVAVEFNVPVAVNRREALARVLIVQGGAQPIIAQHAAGQSGGQAAVLHHVAHVEGPVLVVGRRETVAVEAGAGRVHKHRRAAVYLVAQAAGHQLFQ